MFGPHGGVLGAWDCGRAKVKRWPWVALGIRDFRPHYSKMYPSYLCLTNYLFDHVPIAFLQKYLWIGDACYLDH